MRKGKATLFWMSDLAPAEAATTAAAVPTEILLFKFGENETTKGVFILTRKNADNMVKWFADYGNDLVVDYEHDTWNEKISGHRPAAGWIKALSIRDDGLYCTVSWTPRAVELILAKEYRYTSPSFEYDEDTRELTGLLPLGLVNFPATKHMKPLIAASAREPGASEEKNMKGILKALGLAEDTSEVEVLAALQRWRECGTKLCELTGKRTNDEALGAVLAWKEQAAKVPGLETEVAGFKEKEKTHAADKNKLEVLNLVDKAIKEMRLIPAKKEWAIKLGADNRAMLDGFLEGLPVMAGAAAASGGEGGATGEGGKAAEGGKADETKAPQQPAAGAGAKPGKLSAEARKAYSNMGLSAKAIEEIEKEGETT